MSTQSLVPMFAPDGTIGDVPSDRVSEALSRGFKQGVNVTSKDGQKGTIPIERLQDAVKMGMVPEGAPAVSPTNAPQDTRNGLQRFMDSAGIPRQMGTMQDVKDTLSNMIHPQASPTSPGAGQTLPVVGPIFRANRETFDQPGVAAKVYGSIPLVGPIGYRAGQQLESGDYAGAAGSGLNILLQMLGAKNTNLPKNAGQALQNLGSGLQTAAPYAGKAADLATTGAGVYEAASRGDMRYLLSALLHRKAGEIAEGAVAKTGAGLQSVGNAMNPTVPDAFGNPAFSSATIPTEAQQQRDAFINALRNRGLALPPGPTELPPSSTVAASPTEGVLPAARQVVRDANTGQLRDQFLTSVADPNQTLSINQANAIRKPYSIDELKFINQVRQGLDQQMGEGADAADARMAEYAKTPFDVGGTVKVKLPAQAKSALQQYLENRSLLKPQAQETPITVNAAPPERSILKQGVASGEIQKPIPNNIQYLSDEQALMKQPQVVNPDTDISQALMDSIRRVAAQKRRAAAKTAGR